MPQRKTYAFQMDKTSNAAIRACFLFLYYRKRVRIILQAKIQVSRKDYMKVAYRERVLRSTKFSFSSLTVCCLFFVCVCPQMSPKRHFVVSFATIASVLCRGGWRYLHLSIFDYLIELNVSKSIALNLSLQGEPELTPLRPFFPPDCLSHPRKIESMSIGIPSIVSRSVLCKKSSISYDLS